MHNPESNLFTYIREHRTQKEIPQRKDDRDAIVRLAREYVHTVRIAPPMCMEDLKTHSQRFLAPSSLNRDWLPFAAVMLNNELWRETVESVPYSKRLLLLPKCLRDPQHCRGQVDSIGLVCGHCGRCVIDELSTQAETLGYAVLVAEGSPVVMGLIESGRIEAVIGVSCLATLEQVFPYMEAGAIPGIAVPLLYDGCENTAIDIDWVWDSIYGVRETSASLVHLDDLKKQIQDLFTSDYLDKLIPTTGRQVERIALEWLSAGGKRWRPLLTAAAWQCLAEQNNNQLAPYVRQAAVAVECFHKASLIHDDIEDGDQYRYGRETVHARYGMPIALNAGDYLLGIGYKLLSGLDIDAQRRCRILQIASAGHSRLCLGQGHELDLQSQPEQIASVEEALQIFADKTSPAFAVALSVGAVLGDGDDRLVELIQEFSRDLGMAYQTDDDLQDFVKEDGADLFAHGRLSMLKSLLWEKADAADRDRLLSLLRESNQTDRDQIRELMKKYQIEQHAFAILEALKARAVLRLGNIHQIRFKSLLRRLICKIFRDIQILGCCDEYQNRND